MERGWVGRIEGDRMIHLASQTLQSLFLNGGTAREHAEYPLADVTLLVPVQYPPTVRLFDDAASFRFGNASAVIGDGVPVEGTPPRACARLAAVIGAGGEIGGYSALLEWDDPAAHPAVKQNDFGLVLGPTVATPDAFDPATASFRISGEGVEQREFSADAGFSWPETVALAARRTMLRPGDVLAGPRLAVLEGVAGAVCLEADGIGTLHCPVS